MQEVPFRHWQRNAELTSGRATLIVTLEVGPRIIHAGIDGGPNLFFNFADGQGGIGDGDYQLYGGHRLWIAPEEPGKTMQPDNDPVEYRLIDGEHQFHSKPDINRVSKVLAITAHGDERFTIRHTVTNHNAFDIELATWALSMIDAGGTVFFPQPPFESHQDRVLPNRPITTWGYTKLADPRWTWGDRVASLRQDNEMGPQKIGTFVAQGYAAAEIKGHLLVKSFPALEGEPYPDLGCNFETFTNQDMIEIESLSPMTLLASGESIDHVEHWRIFPNQTVPREDTAAAELLAVLSGKL